MQQITKIIAAVLAGLMLLSLVACAVPDQPTPPETTETKGQPTTDPGSESAETDPLHADPGLPSRSFNDETFRIMASDSYSRGYRARDVEFDDTLTEVSIINEAVRDRNNYIHDKYQATIKGVFDSDVVKTLSNALGAGLTICEVVEASTPSLVSMVELDQLADLNTYSPYLDLTQSWWNQVCRVNLSIAHKLFFMAGDIMTTDKESTWSVCFSRDLVNDNNLANPYDLVDSRDWTYDTMYSLAQQISNAPDHPGDQFGATWGVVSEAGNTYMMWQGSGSRLIVKDAVTDLPSLGPLSEGSYDAMLKVANIQFDKNVTLLSSDVRGVSDVYFDGTIKIFQTGHALFFIGSMSMVEWMRENDMDFGVLPMPKLDKSQNDYYSSVSGGYAYSFAIPNDPSADKEFIAIISQALGCESTDTLIQAYYDKTLVHKGLRRPEDVKMLNLVFGCRVFDLSQVFEWASPLSSQIGSAKTEKKVTALKSKYDSYKNNIDGAIRSFLEKNKFV